MKKEKILVIGAGGQLGSELTQGLWKYHGKENVIASDIKQPEGILAQGNFEILDVLKPEGLLAFLQKNKFTQVYHLAAVLSATGEKNPKAAWKLNMDSLIHVLDAAVMLKIEKVYWPSSIAVFGPTTPKIMTPQHTIMDPITIYGISKQAGERWCEWYHQKHGLDVRSLRYPGIIGWKTHAGGGTTDYAVEIFFQALSQKSYECFLKSDTLLPMMYMDDAIRATLDLMKAPVDKIKIRSSYNVTGMSFSPAEIAAEIKKHIPEFEITYKADFRQSIADSWPKSINDSAAQIDWSWKPQFG
ncbi:MAG TPA: NAD-dependent epimerase/dehydratase family protein, partial [Chryseolinea sp.]|nr:NAD-dependent epimerase/dehydratase family protein [Chryseolinea sp.]